MFKFAKRKTENAAHCESQKLSALFENRYLNNF